MYCNLCIGKLFLYTYSFIHGQYRNTTNSRFRRRNLHNSCQSSTESILFTANCSDLQLQVWRQGLYRNCVGSLVGWTMFTHFSLYRIALFENMKPIILQRKNHF